MAIRKIITIDGRQCNGCGLCLPHCPEGAIQMIDGKARLISDLFCDGLGACLGHCPQGAITIEEREAKPYDENKTMENIVPQGTGVIRAHLGHLRAHGQEKYLREAVDFLRRRGIEIPAEHPASHTHHGGCPGMKSMDFRHEKQDTVTPSTTVQKSELRQWPVQLQLLNPRAPYFDNADLVIAADCVPFAFSAFHPRFLRGKILVIFCPKLDQNLDGYAEKLTAIFTFNTIRSISVVHMEVPCCFGMVQIVEEALKNSEKNIVVKEYTVSLRGEIV